MDNWTIGQLLPAGLPAPIAPDRGGYTVTMRESAGVGEVLEKLAIDLVGYGAIHVGWGSFRNLDIAAARRSAGVLLLDINLHQFRVWQAVGVALNEPACADADAFVEAVVPLLPHQPRLRQFVPSTRDWLLADLDRPGSWLFRGRPDRFEWIRGLFREERVTTGCIDMRAPASSGIFAELADRIAALSRQGATADTLYVSNVPWMLAQNEDFFGEGSPHEASAAALEQARDNLATIAGRFCHVVAAVHLAGTSQEGDLQWQTELLAPGRFLAGAYWARLTPVSGPFRSLR